jgi:hypothetical protein
MTIWWALPVFLGLVGVLFVFGGLGRLLRLRLVTGSLRFLFGGVFLAGAAVVGLVGLNLQTYARLTAERPAAEVTLTQRGPSQFTASVREANSDGLYGEPKDYALTGDSFRMDARILKFRPWANITGLDALYRLERLQGRYDDVAREEASPPKPYDIGDAAGIDVYLLARNRSQIVSAFDAEYGSSTYVPMADGAVYEILVTQNSLIARPQNQVAAQAVRDWTPPAVD